MAFFQRAAQVWRDFVTDGVPSSDKHEPKKSEIRGWARDIENALDALAVTGSFQGRWDASSGSFPSGAQKGYSWIVGAPGTVNGRFFSEGDRIIALVNGASSAAYLNNWVTVPAGASGVTPAVDLGEGTANAIQVKTEAGGGVREGSLLAFTLYRDTTSAPVTLTVDGGGPMTVKSNVGANASALVAGQFILGQVRSGELVFVNDQDVASLVAQAEAARDEAVDLVAGINLPSVSSSDSGKTLFVKPDGSGYDAGRIDTAGRVTFNRIIDAPLLVQKKLMEPFTGLDNGIGTNTEIFAGAGFTAQGLTVVTTSDGTRYLFIVIRCVADNYKVTERCRIVQYPLKDDGTLGAHVAFSEELNIGHAGGLSHTVDSSDNITFYSWMPTMVGHEDNDAGKGFSKIEWAGSATSQSDVTGYQVFGWNGSHTSRSKYRHMDCSVDLASREIAFIGYKNVLSGDEFINQTVFIFDLDDLLDAADDAARLIVAPKHQWVHTTANLDRGMYKQGIAIRKGVVATISGFTNPLSPEVISLFDVHGNLIRREFPTSIRSEYGREGIVNHPTLGNPIQFEPEGIFWLDDSELVFLMMDQWRASPSIVNYSSPGGVTKRFARIASSGVAAPTQVDQWVETTKAATSGDWSASGTYSLGSAITRRSKVVYSLRVPRGDAGEVALSAGMPDGWAVDKPALSYEMTPNITFKAESPFNVCGYSQVLDEYMPAFSYLYTRTGASSLRLNDFWSQGGPGWQLGYTWSATAGRYVGSLAFASGTGGIFFYGDEDPSTPGQSVVRTRGGGGFRVSSGGTGALSAWAQGADLGLSSTRWGTVYAQNALNTSDARVKDADQDTFKVTPLNEAEIAASKELVTEVGVFRFINGFDDGFIHIGMTVQRIIGILQSHGLDWRSYGFVRYDTWGDEPEVIDPETGAVLQEPIIAGDLYSINAAELTMFMIRGLEARLTEAGI